MTTGRIRYAEAFCWIPVQILSLIHIYRVLAPDVDTVFLTTSLEYAYVSSTIMKEVARFGGDLSKFAPPEIIQALQDKMQEEKDNKENVQ